VVRFQAVWIKQAPLQGWQRWLARLLHAWEKTPKLEICQLITFLNPENSEIESPWNSDLKLSAFVYPEIKKTNLN